MSPDKTSLSSHLTFPPTDGTVTVPEVLDFHNDHQPYHTMFIFKADGEDKITDISFFEFRRAADRVAHLIRPQRQGKEGEVVAVVALSDTVLHHAAAIGLIRAGMVPYLMSPRNTAPAIIKMLKETACHKILTTQETLKPLISGIKQTLDAEKDPYHLDIIEMPPLFTIFPQMGRETSEDSFEEYPKVSSRPGLDQTLLYLHSSGSTGLPKSIKQSFLTMCNWAAMPGRTELMGRTMACMALPAFHTLGFATQVLGPLYGLYKVALYPPVADVPSKLPIMPTTDNIIEHSQRTGCEEMIGIPAMYQVWMLKENTVRYLASLKLVVYAGGPVPSDTGRRLVDAGVNLISVYGATEVGPPTYWTRRPRRTSEAEHHWEYSMFDEKLNVHFEPQGDGTYELQFLRHETRHDLPVENMGPDVRGYATSDLWVQHPSEPGFWKLIGRKDDVIVHSSGEKTVPGPMENIIAQSAWVTSVIMFGYKHDQPGVLIELDSDHAIDPRNEVEVAKSRNAIWPLIERANKVAPSFSKIYKEFILFNDPQKPLPRAGKGTVLRKAALAEYLDEIEALYAVVSAISGTNGIAHPGSWNEGDVSKWLMAQIKNILPDLTFVAEKDLFDQGLDSLSATVLRRRIYATIKSDLAVAYAFEAIAQNTVYAYPTVRSLSEFVSASVHSPHTNGTTTTLKKKGLTSAIEEMIEKYSHGLDAGIHRTKLLPECHTVLLTGSTGNLGSQILEALLCDSRVEKVYALNRPSTQGALMKHRERFADKGLDTELLCTAKLIFFEGDISDSQLGLPEETYTEITNNVTLIIHCAWRLNFNLSLPSFESNICGTRQLIDLGRASPYGEQVRFVFTSSVSQALSWDTEQGAYPEEVLLDPRYALGIGYGESKYVCERILSRCGLETTSLRIGQITGGVPSGSWPIDDWVPIMVKSSIALGALPSQKGSASWIPIHAVTQAMLDISVHVSLELPRAFNIVHPEPISFDSMMSYINEALASTCVITAPLAIIPQSEWLQILEVRAQDSSKRNMERIPAIKLLQFFRAAAHADASARAGLLKGVESGGITRFSTAKATMASKAMSHLPVLDEHHALSWVKYWHARRFFS